MKLRGVLLPLVAVATLFCSFSALAQRVEARLKSGITESNRVVLRESRTPQVRDAEDLGAVSPETIVPGVTLVFRRSAEQETALQELIQAQQDAGSPRYHQWLTPESFAARFGVADEDIATTESWLAGHGFHVDRVARSRDRITFSGTAAQVQAAFGAELRHYRVEGAVHFAPAADLMLPAELAPMTAAVLHLSDFRPKPSVKVLPKPEYTTAAGAHYLAPGDVETMYDLDPLYDTAQQLSGRGLGLAVVGQSYVNTQSPIFVDEFSQVKSTIPVIVPGSGVEAISPGDEGESEIDLEYSSSITGNVNLYFVYVGNGQNYNVFDALALTIEDDIAPVVSVSYAECEPLMSSTDLQQSNALFEEATVQGQTLVASAGDTGSTACSSYTTAQGVTQTEQQALAVNFPADSPYVTAVGGTQMAAGSFTAGASPYWASTSGSDDVISLLSYAPEVAWNEGSAANGIQAGGGGTSAYFPRPTWQSGVPGITSGSNRLLPDISVQASVSSPGYVFCSDDPDLIASEGQTSSCVNGFLGSNNGYTTAGGTSFGAPILAGYLVILNASQNADGLGNINPVLYKLASDPTTYAKAFHDITSGTIACIAGAGNCVATGESGYATTVGYDEATGLGSLDFSALATVWPATKTATLKPSLTVNFWNENPVAAGTTVSMQAQVATGGMYTLQNTPIPTGTVSVSMDGVSIGAPLTLTPNLDQAIGMANFSIIAPSTAGTHLVTLSYSGDSVHAPSSYTAAVPVGSTLATGGVSLAAPGLTIANGGTGSTTVTVTPTGGYNGNLVWSLNAAATAGTTTALSACYGIASLPVNGVTTTKLSFGVGSACSAASAAERGAFRQIVQRSSAGGSSMNGTAKNEAPVSGGRTLGAATIAGAGLLLCGLFGRRRRRRLPGLLALVCLAIVGLGVSGCGGGQSSASSSTSTTSTNASYTLTLTGTDSVNGSISASTSFVLTVN